jgi:hypothetical protein
MKKLYLIIHLGAYPDHSCWGPGEPEGETDKVKLQRKFIEKIIPKIKKGKADIVIVGGPRCLLENYLEQEELLFKFRRDSPTDEEVRSLNERIGQTKYKLIPVGFHSDDCVPAIVGALLYGKGHYSSGHELTLTERLNVHSHKVIPKLLIPPRKTLDLKH